jgi:hypothetical protein
MNVAAIKQVVPYVKFLARAGAEKARHAMAGDEVVAGAR